MSEIFRNSQMHSETNGNKTAIESQMTAANLGYTPAILCAELSCSDDWVLTGADSPFAQMMCLGNLQNNTIAPSSHVMTPALSSSFALNIMLLIDKFSTSKPSVGVIILEIRRRKVFPPSFF